ncbi:MAG: N-acetyltransferase [Chlamydiota bacterium]
MNLANFGIRKATFDDGDKIKTLYQTVTKNPGGIARTSDEITPGYIDRILTNSLEKGLIMVSYSKDTHELIGSIHAYKLDPKVFRHILSELTIVIHPDFQGMGLGKALFSTFLNEIENLYPSILRVELITRESNHKGLSLYKSLGFIAEGRFEKRIFPETHILEADIPMVWFNPNFQPSL